MIGIVLGAKSYNNDQHGQGPTLRMQREDPPVVGLPVIVSLLLLFPAAFSIFLPHPAFSNFPFPSDSFLSMPLHTGALLGLSNKYHGQTVGYSRAQGQGSYDVHIAGKALCI